VGYPKDVFEVESYVRGFARRRPDVRVTTLRMANVIGPVITSPLTSYFKLPVIPTVLGFDPRLQFLHEHDAHLSLEHATLTDVPGTFNVVGDGTLMLSQCVRRLGRPAVPLPSFGVAAFGNAMKQARLVDFSREQVAYLTYGRGMDATRMREELGYEPAYTTEQAFDDFVGSVSPGLLRPERVRAAEQALASALAGRAHHQVAAIDTEGSVRS
jgi:UDP-glucose 4-epimerase